MASPPKGLTALSVANARPGEKVREIPDGNGLYLVVFPTGQRSWVYRYRRPDTGKNAKVTLGKFNPQGAKDDAPGYLSLSGARQRAAELSHVLATGRDPALKEDSDSFAAVVRDYAEYVRRNKKRPEHILAVLGWKFDAPAKGGLAERWGNRKMTDISPDNAFAVVTESRLKGIPGIGVKVSGPVDSRGRLMFATLSAFFSWAVRERRAKVNPLTALSRPKPPKSRERTLSDDELRELWRAAEAYGPPFGQIVLLLITTGQRLREISELKWSEYKGDRLELPSGRMKAGRAHVVPLSSLAQEVMATVERTNNPYVFAGLKPNRPFSGFSRAKSNMPDFDQEWTLHDIRRTVASKLAKLGVRVEVAERLLSHAASQTLGGIVAVYNLHDYADEKREAVELWAAKLREIISGDE